MLAPKKRTSFSDIESKINFPSHAEVKDAHTRLPSWLVDARDAEFAGPSSRVTTIVDGTVAPQSTALIGEASTSQPNAITPAVGNVDFAQSTAVSLRISLALAEEGNAMHNAM